MTNKLMTIPEYIKNHFCPGSEPSARTVRGWINTGKIDAVKLGREYYIADNINVSYTYQTPQTALVNRVLNS